MAIFYKSESGAGIAVIGTHSYQSENTDFVNEGVTGATTVTLSGSASGPVNVASSNFTVGVNATPISGTLVVTPATNISSGGSFSPTTVSLTTGSPTATFTFTPSKSGVHTISVTNNGGLINAAPLTYTVIPAATVTLVAGPSDSTPQTGLSSLHWNWRDVTDENSAAAPTDRGATGTTNGSGVFTVSLPNSTLTNGQQGWLHISNAAGTSVASGIVAVD